jgi:hypothetical protein
MPVPPKAEEIKLKFIGICARCGESHIGVSFVRLPQPIRGNGGEVMYTHWSTCPKREEPVFIRVLRGASIGDEFIFSEPTPLKRETK